jgi:uncharacterized protein YbjT (DUF2867 family)
MPVIGRGFWSGRAASRRSRSRSIAISSRATSPIRALDRCLEGSDAVIYLIGILREFPSRGVTFDALQRVGVEDTIAAAKRQGWDRFILMSANGVHVEGTPYQRSKALAEAALKASGLRWTIFRPSVIFGDPDGRMEFCSQLKKDIIDSPMPAPLFYSGLIPKNAGGFELAPVHVDDVAAAFVLALTESRTESQTYSLCGPQRLSWKAILTTIAAASGKTKLMLPAPAMAIKATAGLLDRYPWFPISRDQIKMLMEGNVCFENDRPPSRRLGLTPTRCPSVLEWLGRAGSDDCRYSKILSSKPRLTGIEDISEAKRTIGRMSARSELVEIGHAAELCHLTPDPGGAALYGRRRCFESIDVGIRQHGGDQGGIRAAQRHHRAVEIAPARGPDAEGVRAELGDVEIDLEDPLLGPKRLDQEGEPDLQSFANRVPAGPEKEVLCRLLADGARPAQPLPGTIALPGALDLDGVESAVTGEALILRGDDGELDGRRDGVPIDPLVIDVRRLAGLGMGGDPALNHEGGGRRVDPAQDRDQHDRQCHHACEHEGDPAQQHFPRAFFRAAMIAGDASGLVEPPRSDPSKGVAEVSGP